MNSSKVARSSPEETLSLVRRVAPVKSGWLHARAVGHFVWRANKRCWAELRGNTLLLHVVGEQSSRADPEQLARRTAAENIMMVSLKDAVVATDTKSHRIRIKRAKGERTIELRLRNAADSKKWHMAISRCATQRAPSLDDFELLAQVGKGASGRVFLVRDRLNGERLALKVIEKNSVYENEDAYRHALDERLVLEMACDHPFILNLRYAFQTTNRLYLVTEFCDGGDLFDYLKKKGKPFKEAEGRRIAGEILLALEHIHSLGVVYRDLKLENVLLDLDGHVRIADFGLSKLLGKRRHAAVRTSQHQPPHVQPPPYPGQPHDPDDPDDEHDHHQQQHIQFQPQQQQQHTHYNPYQQQQHQPHGHHPGLPPHPHQQHYAHQPQQDPYQHPVSDVYNDASSNQPPNSANQPLNTANQLPHQKPPRSNKKNNKHSFESVSAPLPPGVAHPNGNPAAAPAPAPKPALKPVNMTKTFCGTREYVAPEMLSGNEYGQSVDLWAFGILLYEILCGRTPFYSRNREEVYSKIENGALRFPRNLSQDVISLIRGLLDRNPKTRLGLGPEGINEIKRHAFFRGMDWDGLAHKAAHPDNIKVEKNLVEEHHSHQDEQQQQQESNKSSSSQHNSSSGNGKSNEHRSKKKKQEQEEEQAASKQQQQHKHKEKQSSDGVSDVFGKDTDLLLLDDDDDDGKKKRPDIFAMFVATKKKASNIPGYSYMARPAATVAMDGVSPREDLPN